MLDANYNKTLGSLLRLCSSFIASALRNERIDTEVWAHSFAGQWNKLHKLDAVREKAPKYSYYCFDLAQVTKATPTSKTLLGLDSSRAQ
jgi:hypothetical protein